MLSSKKNSICNSDFKLEHKIQIIICSFIILTSILTNNWYIFFLCIFTTITLYFINIWLYKCPLNTPNYIDIPLTKLNNSKCMDKSKGYYTTIEMYIITQCILCLKGCFWLFKLNSLNIINHLKSFKM